MNEEDFGTYLNRRRRYLMFLDASPSLHGKEDHCQECFLRALLRFRKDSKTNKEREWRPSFLATIIRNLVRDEARKKRVVTEPLDVERHQPTDPRENRHEGLMGFIDVVKAQLTPEHFQVFCDRHVLGMSFDEIAQKHKRAVGTIKTWVLRDIVKRLRQARAIRGFESFLSK